MQNIVNDGLMNGGSLMLTTQTMKIDVQGLSKGNYILVKTYRDGSRKSAKFIKP